MSESPKIPDPCWSCWMEIDLGAVRHNVRAVKQALAPGVRLMAVVKADGYGHGAVPVAQAALEAGADALAVAQQEEGGILRQASIAAPLLVMGAFQSEQAGQAVRWRLDQAVCSAQAALALSEAAVRAGWRAPVHLKVDTGMGRIGVAPEQAPEMARLIASLPGLELAGIFSHLACADQDSPCNQAQVSLMRQLGERLSAGVPLHLANSAGTVLCPEAHFDMVRVGLLVYGLEPCRRPAIPLDLRPALSWHTRICFAKRVPAGTSLSYGGAHVTKRATTIATLPVGYADGYPRSLSDRGQVLWRGRRCPVVGRVCMDQLLVDLGEQAAQVGDPVVLIGEQDGERITANDLADSGETVVHEIVARLGKRPPRIYID